MPSISGWLVVISFVSWTGSSAVAPNKAGPEPLADRALRFLQEYAPEEDKSLTLDFLKVPCDTLCAIALDGLPAKISDPDTCIILHVFR